MIIENMNVWGSVVGAVIVFFLGGMWYSPKMFGSVWCSQAELDKSKMEKSHKPHVFIISFIYLIIAAMAFSHYLGDSIDLSTAVIQGLIVGLCFVSTSFGINYLFANRSIKMFLIDAGYHTLQFVIYGLVFAYWPA